MKQTKPIPLVLILSPDLKLIQERMVYGGKRQFLNIFDTYLNNAGIALARFPYKKNNKINIKDATSRVKALAASIIATGKFKPLLLLSFGSASPLAIHLLKQNIGKTAFLIGPHFGSIHQMIRWRFEQQPLQHYLLCFDMNGDKQVTRKEWQQDLYKDRKGFYKNKSFCDFDTDKNNLVNASDFKRNNASRLKQIMNNLKANKLHSNSKIPESSTWLHSLLKVPMAQPDGKQSIFIFQGTEDPYTDSDRVKRLAHTMNKSDKKRVFIFAGHDHELNWSEYARLGKLPDGLLTLFRCIFKHMGLKE